MRALNTALVTIGILTCAAPATSAPLRGVAGKTGSAVAVGTSMILFSSNLQRSWFQASGFNPLLDYTAVAATPSGYVAVASNGSVWSATDPAGTGWIQRDTPSTRALRAVEVVGSRLVAVGDGGVIYRSANYDGTGWASQSSGVTSTLRALANNGTFTIVVGDGGVILRGNNEGTNFTRITVDETRDLLGVCVNALNRTFLAVGRDGVMLRANADGSTWTPLTEITSSTLYACNTDNLPYGLATVVVGAGGIAFYASNNFTNWIETNTQTGVDLHDLAFTGVSFLAVGDNRETFWSQIGLTWELGAVPTQQITWGSLKARYQP
ncbi:MAG: hypothetical protein IT349_11305 [Candidatus Eisenbacteria bacterium]|nr:hypothetical protein [Candidatus Eisenbacteria bacterium]MCC7142675.1 hypothetical protein [Candidatus Eisenbacteria bacterium]